MSALLFLLMAGEVGAGDLEGVEEQTGASRVDVVVGDAGEDLAEGALDGGAAGGGFEAETVAAGLTLLEVGDGFASGVMVVTKFFSPHGRTATTLAGGEGVAALAARG